MSKGIRRFLPHVAILLCNMYIVFFLIDRVNTAMNFIDNNLTKGILAALCVVSLINSAQMIRASRRAERRRRRKAAAAKARG